MPETELGFLPAEPMLLAWADHLGAMLPLRGAGLPPSLWLESPRSQVMDFPVSATTQTYPTAGSVTNAILFPEATNTLGQPHTEHSSGMVLGHAGEGIGPGATGGDVNQFHSLHGAGANFVFADGHVAFLAAEMDYRTYRSLATRAGGENIAGGF